MLTLDATQSALVAADNKTARWCIRIYDTDGVGYGYYTDAIGATGWAVDLDWITGVAWYSGISNDVVIMDFNGIELRRNSSESGIIAPSDLTFTMSNPENTYDFTKFKGGTVFVELYLWNPTYGEQKINGWKFDIKTCEPGYQKLRFTCEDFLQAYLRGDYPNTRIPEDVFKSARNYQRANVCVPVPFGTAYVPLRDVYIESAVTLTNTNIACVAAATTNRAKITGTGLSVFGLGNSITISGFTTAANNGTFIPLKISATEIEFSATTLVDEAAGDTVTLTQNQPFFMLGDTTNTYTITKLHAPKDPFGGSEYPGATEARALSVVFPQSTHADSDGANWRLFKSLTVDMDGDGINEEPGSYTTSGGITHDPIVQFTRSDTVSITNPADVIAFVLKDMGIAAADIDESGSFAAAHLVYDAYAVPLTFNGAFWYKQPREKVLAQLLTMCHSCLDVGETIKLRVLSATQAGTDITAADILRSPEQGEGSFSYRDIVSEDYSDSVYVTWQQTGKPQDTFLKVLVAADATANVIPNQVLECQFVQDSRNVQRIGKLYSQRKFGKVATVGFLSKSSRLAHQPDDVLEISAANYGGTYKVLVDSIKINKDCSIQFGCTKFSYTLQNWTDISPTALTVPDDDTTNTWEPTISGPQTDQDIGRSAFNIWGKEYLTVGPVANQGKYSDIQSALNAVKQAGGGAIYLLNGTYQMTAPLYVPDVNLEIVGQSQGGVVLKNAAGQDLWVLTNLTKTLSFCGFSIESQNTTTYSKMFISSGASRTEALLISDVTMILVDDGMYNGDSGLYITEGIGGSNTTQRVSVNGGSYGIFIEEINPFAATISGCVIDDSKAGCIYVYSGNGNAVITGNLCQDVRNKGIVADGSYYGDGNYFHIGNNTVISHATALLGYASLFQGIYIAGIPFEASSNSITISSSDSQAIVLYGISIGSGAKGTAAKNTILISSSTTAGSSYGINLGGSNCILSGNIISLSATSCTARYGIYVVSGFFSTGDRNVISSNHIDLVNNAAADVGIRLTSGANDNQGSDNITYNVGTSISNSGTGNNITAKDV